MRSAAHESQTSVFPRRTIHQHHCIDADSIKKFPGGWHRLATFAMPSERGSQKTVLHHCASKASARKRDQIRPPVNGERRRSEKLFADSLFCGFNGWFLVLGDALRTLRFEMSGDCFSIPSSSRVRKYKIGCEIDVCLAIASDVLLKRVAGPCPSKARAQKNGSTLHSLFALP